MSRDDRTAIARIVDANRYMTLGTADASGTPWVSPVWYATFDYTRFYWVSDPNARHSRNLAERSDVSIVIFDSSVAVGSAAAAYLAGRAKELTDAELDEGIAVFSERSVEQGLSPWTRSNVEHPAKHRLYRATIEEWSVLGPGDRRLPVDLGRR